MVRVLILVLSASNKALPDRYIGHTDINGAQLIFEKKKKILSVPYRP